jgi:ABC-type Mn2+/Zn2+ transport system permease subunit
MDLINTLLDPLQYEFMRMAILTAITVGITSSVLSSFIVLRGWSLLGDAISHSVLPGIAVSVALGTPVFWGALLTGIASSALIGLVESKSRVRNDTAIGIVFTGAFALGLVIISRIRPSIDVFHILFGNVLGVSYQDLLLTALSGGAILTAIGLGFKEIVAYSFDPTFAKVVGLRTGLIHYSMMVLLSLAIVAALQTAGIILVISLLVTPGATAQLVAKTMGGMVAISMLTGLASVVLGIYLSYYLSVSSGGAIALIATLVFFTTLVAKHVRAVRL